MMNSKFMNSFMYVLDGANIYLLFLMLFMILFVPGSISLGISALILALLSFNFVVNLFVPKNK